MRSGPQPLEPVWKEGVEVGKGCAPRSRHVGQGHETADVFELPQLLQETRGPLIERQRLVERPQVARSRLLEVRFHQVLGRLRIPERLVTVQEDVQQPPVRHARQVELAADERLCGALQEIVHLLRPRALKAGVIIPAIAPVVRVPRPFI